MMKKRAIMEIFRPIPATQMTFRTQTYEMKSLRKLGYTLNMVLRLTWIT